MKYSKEDYKLGELAYNAYWDEISQASRSFFQLQQEEKDAWAAVGIAISYRPIE